MHLPTATGTWPVLARQVSACLLLFLLASLPFLVPTHIRPITSFYNEWWAAILSLGLITVAIIGAWPQRALSLPTICLLPAVFLFVIGLQLLLGRIYFPQQALIYACYLLLAAAMMLAGHALFQLLGERLLIRSLALGFAFGALLQLIAALLQIQGSHWAGFTLPLLSGYGVYGNIGQANHLAHYLWLGLVSLIVLYRTQVISRASFWLGVLALALVLPYTGSRSVFLYPAAMLILALAHRRQVGTTAAPLLFCVLAIAVMTVASGLLPRATIPGITTPGTPAERMLQSIAEPRSASTRLGLWRTGLDATAAAPWLGGGVGAVPRQTLDHVAAVPKEGRIGVAEHFHNLVINWLAEFGVPATFVAIALLGHWGFAVWRRHRTVEAWWLFAILLIGSIHSLLEYPLWHANFLAPTALLLGAYSRSGPKLRFTPLISVVLVASALLAGLMLHNLRGDHLRLARVIHIVPSGPQAQQIWRAHMDDLVALHRESLFSPYVNGMLAVAMDTDRENIAAKRLICDAALHFSPTASVVFKCAAIDTLGGDSTKGKELLRLALLAFPNNKANAQTELAKLAEQFPELAELAAMAASE